MIKEPEEELRDFVIKLGSASSRAKLLARLLRGEIRAHEVFPHLSSQPLAVPANMWGGVHEADLHKWAARREETTALKSRVRRYRDESLNGQIGGLGELTDMLEWCQWGISYVDLKENLPEDLHGLLSDDVWAECRAANPQVVKALGDESDDIAFPPLSKDAERELTLVTKTWRRFLDKALNAPFNPLATTAAVREWETLPRAANEIVDYSSKAEKELSSPSPDAIEVANDEWVISHMVALGKLIRPYRTKTSSQWQDVCNKLRKKLGKSEYQNKVQFDRQIWIEANRGRRLSQGAPYGQGRNQAIKIEAWYFGEISDQNDTADLVAAAIKARADFKALPVPPQARRRKKPPQKSPQN